MSENIDYSQIPNELNKRIQFIRNKHGYTQKEIAEFLNVDRATYTKYETGDRTIPIDVIIGLAKVYSVSTDFILAVSAKPHYVDYDNYHTKLSPRATERLQGLSEYDNCLYGVNALLENKNVYKIFYLLGLLLKFPNNLDDLFEESKEQEIKFDMFLEYMGDFVKILKLPKEMFGIQSEPLLMREGIYVPDIIETYFHIYLDKFINEIRESPETKKAFFDELKRVYYKDVKKENENMKKYFEQSKQKEAQEVNETE